MSIALRDVAELALVDRADLVVDALLLVGVGDEIGLLRVDREQVLPAREAEVELDERVERAEVVRVELEDLAVDGDRRFGRSRTSSSIAAAWKSASFFSCGSSRISALRWRISDSSA